MTNLTSACAAGAFLLASLFPSVAAPIAVADRIYDGRQPPACDIRNVRLRHFEGDGHDRGHPEHAHLGHGHRWSKRNHKGQPMKPPCYVRAAAAETLSGDLS